MKEIGQELRGRVTERYGSDIKYKAFRGLPQPTFTLEPDKLVFVVRSPDDGIGFYREDNLDRRDSSWAEPYLPRKDQTYPVKFPDGKLETCILHYPDKLTREDGRVYGLSDGLLRLVGQPLWIDERGIWDGGNWYFFAGHKLMDGQITPEELSFIVRCYDGMASINNENKFPERPRNTTNGAGKYFPLVTYLSKKVPIDPRLKPFDDFLKKQFGEEGHIL